MSRFLASIKLVDGSFIAKEFEGIHAAKEWITKSKRDDGFWIQDKWPKEETFIPWHAIVKVDFEELR